MANDMENNEIENSPLQDEDPDDVEARLALARKARRYHAFSIAGFCLAALQLVQWLSSFEKQTLRVSFASALAIIGVVGSGFTFRRLSRKGGLRALQDGPLTDEPTRPFQMKRIVAGSALGIVVFVALQSAEP